MLVNAFKRRIHFALGLAIVAVIGGCATSSARRSTLTSTPTYSVATTQDTSANNLPDLRHAVAEEQSSTSTAHEMPDDLATEVVQAEHVEPGTQPPTVTASKTDETLADGFAIDLPTAMQLAGANNLNSINEDPASDQPEVADAPSAPLEHAHQDENPAQMGWASQPDPKGFGEMSPFSNLGSLDEAMFEVDDSTPAGDIVARATLADEPEPALPVTDGSPGGDTGD